MVKILDSTLREGEQTAGVKFTKKQKIEIAKLLNDIGIDKIEVGHPVISPYDEECVRSIGTLKLKCEVLAHARAKIEDIDAVLRCNVKWIGIFMGINDISLKYKYNNIKKKEALKKIETAISYSKKQNLKVRFTIEDATRTNIKDIKQIIKIGSEQGVDVISIADTVGYMTPDGFFIFLNQIKEFTEIPIEVHCHNDLGLALANSLVAYQLGIDTIDVTINGLGERAALTSLAELCAVLKFKYNENKCDIRKLNHISNIVSKYTKIQMDKLRPIIGENAFTHTAKLHRKAVKKWPPTYELFNPLILGRKRVLYGENNNKGKQGKN